MKIKNINPVDKSDEIFNIVLTKFSDETKLEAYLQIQNIQFSFELKLQEIKLTYNNFNYLDILKKIITTDEIPNSYEVIGKIAHLNLREKFLYLKQLIGQLILDVSIIKK